MIPISGSAYTYAYATLGELVAWIIGWDLMLEYAVGNVAVAIAWSGYFSSLLRAFGVEMPFWLSTSYRDVLFSHPRAPGRAAGALRPPHRDQRARHRDRGAHHLGAGHRHPGERARQQRDGGPEAGGAGAVRGRGRLLRRPRQLARPSRPTAGKASTRAPRSSSSPTSASTRSPRPPRRRRTRSGTCRSGSWARSPSARSSTRWSAWWRPGSCPTRSSRAPTPWRARSRCAGIGWGQAIVSLGAVISMTAVLLVFQLGQPRIFFSMSRDGLLPPWFRSVHPRYRHAARDHDPHRAWSWPWARRSSTTTRPTTSRTSARCSPSWWCAWACSPCASRTRTGRGPFRVPFVWVVAPLGALACLYVMTGLPAHGLVPLRDLDGGRRRDLLRLRLPAQPRGGAPAPARALAP